MKADGHIKHDVEAELHWSPELDDTDMRVEVLDGAVTLDGSARNYAEKVRAEAVVKRVSGVVAVINQLRVRLDSETVLADSDVARAVQAAIAMALPIAGPKIDVLVSKGHVSLEGTVSWHFQRERALEAARRVKGVVDVGDLIEVIPTITAGELKHRIEAAFRRSAAIDAKRVSVEECRGEVTLRGRVRSWAERDEAERAAWAAPGVTRVNNEISVRHHSPD
jgi:osmotically-inducible protein OsmY